MNTVLYIIVVLIICSVAVLSITWRCLSRWLTLPCPAWLAWLVELDNPFSRMHKAATIIEHLGLSQGMVVLDVGCGPGRLTIPVARVVGVYGKVVAMDIQKDMLNIVQKKSQEARLQNIILLPGKIGEGHLDHDAYDRVLLIAVLGEIVDQRAAFKEIFFALKPGGILSVTETIFDPHYQRYGSVLKLAQSIGFIKQKTFSDCFSFTLNLQKPSARLL